MSAAFINTTVINYSSLLSFVYPNTLSKIYLISLCLSIITFVYSTSFTGNNVIRIEGRSSDTYLISDSLVLVTVSFFTYILMFLFYSYEYFFFNVTNFSSYSVTMVNTSLVLICSIILIGAVIAALVKNPCKELKKNLVLFVLEAILVGISLYSMLYTVFEIIFQVPDSYTSRVLYPFIMFSATISTCLMAGRDMLQA